MTSARQGGTYGALVAVAALLASSGAIAVGSACMASAPAPKESEIDPRKHEIAHLWSQIRDWRQEAGLPGVEPPMRDIVKMHGKTIAAARQVCRVEAEPSTTTCKDVCSLSDAICDNAGSICRIAGELAGDSWAQDKCASAKASCKEAKLRCCDCKSRELPVPEEDPTTNEPADASDASPRALDESP